MKIRDIQEMVFTGLDGKVERMAFSENIRSYHEWLVNTEPKYLIEKKELFVKKSPILAPNLARVVIEDALLESIEDTYGEESFYNDAVRVMSKIVSINPGTPDYVFAMRDVIELLNKMEQMKVEP